MTPLCLHPLALSPWDRIRLHGSGELGFRKGAGLERADERGTCRRGKNPRYGYVRLLAFRIIKGDFGPAPDLSAICHKEAVNPDSLKITLGKIRRKPQLNTAVSNTGEKTKT